MIRYTVHFLFVALIIDMLLSLIFLKFIELPFKAVIPKAFLVAILYSVFIAVLYFTSITIERSKAVVGMVAISYIYLSICTYILSTNRMNYFEILIESHSNESYMYIYGSNLISLVCSYFVMKHVMID